ncbi:MAG TPA: Rho termination factor N-terminal domain-containing protein, partial [Propionibacteriaceae bacterium]|nr:Rho termination factor N-terminal domain-containing protein [Propionibacteriaceae bacterium]
MTEIAEVTSASPIEEGAGEQGTQLSNDRRNRKGSGLDSMVLAELKQLAGSLGIKGTGGMRKSQLIDAIKAARSDAGTPALAGGTRPDNGQILGSQSQAGRETGGQRDDVQVLQHPAQPELVTATQTTDSTPTEGRARTDFSDGDQVPEQNGTPQNRVDQVREDTGTQETGDGQRERNRSDEQARGEEQAPEARSGDGERGEGSREGRQNDRRDRRNQPARENQQRDNQGRDGQGRDWDEEGGGRRGRRRRSRDRQNRRNRGGGNLERYDSEPVVSEDDVLVPARGILDVLDNYAFVRTNGYLPGPDDAYVSLSMVKKLGLRKGDLVTGVIRTPREGERKEKFNPMVRIDTINGGDLESFKQRPDFAKLTPLYPKVRFKLETTATQ